MPNSEVHAKLNFVIHPGRIFRVLTYIVLALTFVSTAVLSVGWITGHTYLMGLVPLFNVGKEANVPTWYSSFALLLCSALFYAIASAEKAAKTHHAFHWRALAVIFLFFSADEASSIHETIGGVFERVFHTSIFTNYGWAAPGAVLAVVVGLLFARFLIHLPAATRRLFIIAGALYMAGVSGMEVVSLRWGLAYGTGNVGYRLLATLEELLEMMGVVVLIYALALHIARYMPRKEILIRFTDAEKPRPAASVKETRYTSRLPRHRRPQETKRPLA